MSEVLAFKKETRLTARVDASLRDNFIHLSNIQDIPYSQILRDLIRGYIDAHQDLLISNASSLKNNVATTSDKDVDIMLRSWNAKSAQASVGLEGLTVSDSTLALTNKYISGELAIDDIINQVLAQANNNG